MLTVTSVCWLVQEHDCFSHSFLCNNNLKPLNICIYVCVHANIHACMYTGACARMPLIGEVEKFMYLTEKIISMLNKSTTS